MKCKYCGGEVGLEEKFCPYCGNPNEQAVRHVRDMADYQERYAETEATVVGATRRYAQVIPRAVVILLLLIAIAVMAFVTENAYSFPEQRRRRAAEKDSAGTIATLEEYLERREYVSFASYMEYNDIRTYGTPFEAYSDLKWVTQCYKEVLLRTERLFLHEDSEKWASVSAPDDIRFLCQSLDSFFEAVERVQKRSTEDSYGVYMEQMRSDVMELLRVYFRIEGAEVEEFLTMSSNRKAAWLEEVLLDA